MSNIHHKKDMFVRNLGLALDEAIRDPVKAPFLGHSGNTSLINRDLHIRKLSMLAVLIIDTTQSSIPAAGPHSALIIPQRQLGIKDIINVMSDKHRLLRQIGLTDHDENEAYNLLDVYHAILVRAYQITQNERSLKKMGRAA
ncbi:MAG: hypothetical protein K2Q12_08750 [Rickettsiales bacterium]|nr:hypothetical protein [Rickettsiales bacterium]